jgi:hypothetical protein
MALVVLVALVVVVVLIVVVVVVVLLVVMFGVILWSRCYVGGGFEDDICDCVFGGGFYNGVDFGGGDSGCGGCSGGFAGGYRRCGAGSVC